MFAGPRRRHMTHADCEQTQEQVNDSDHPMKVTYDERRLAQAKGDHEGANDDAHYRDHPTPGISECLCNSNDPQSADREESEQHVE